jgi:hypothetical protein
VAGLAARAPPATMQLVGVTKLGQMSLAMTQSIPMRCNKAPDISLTQALTCYFSKLGKLAIPARGESFCWGTCCKPGHKVP